MERKAFTLESLKEQIAEARRATAEADAREPRARSARYDSEANRIIVDLRSGAAFVFPPEMVPELEEASPGQLADVSVDPSGDGLRWNQLDVDLGLSTLLVGVFGTSAWMSETGRQGGCSTSEQKRAAARANGKKGGRPRKAAI